MVVQRRSLPRRNNDNKACCCLPLIVLLWLGCLLMATQQQILLRLPAANAFVLFPSSYSSFPPRISRGGNSNSRSRSSTTHCWAATSDDHVTEELKHDIEVLKEEAKVRLDKLMEQMEELKHVNKEGVRSTANTRTSASTTTITAKKETPPSSSSASATRKATATTTDQPKKKKTSIDKQKGEEQQLAKLAMEFQNRQQQLDLLDDTVWQIVFNIGREKGTWMPKEWGVSGDRLLFSCTVDFTSESVTTNAEYHDDFFQGNDELKILKITNSFVTPRGVGMSSVGRRPLPVIPTGAYKVCRGQGPAGTDIVRLFIELTDKVNVPDHDSDVYCPKGRIYGTCGYFVIPPTTHPADHPTGGVSYRELLEEQYYASVREYETLQMELETDEHLFSLDHLNKLKDMWKAKAHMEQLGSDYNIARQREPEKSQLRLSKKRNAGLSREGGVCCKVHKGLALEYHILGRMEVGCVEDHHDETLLEQQQKLTL